MKTFRVYAESSELFYIDVKAKNENEAITIAEDLDGGQFTLVQPSMAWDIIKAREVR